MRLQIFRRISLMGWLVLAIGAGLLAGWLWPKQAQGLQFVSTIFLHLIKCVVAPLIFATLVTGIAGHADDLKVVGRLAVKSLIYFELASAAALGAGWLMVTWWQPGVGVHLGAGSGGDQPVAIAITLAGVLEHAVPQSIVDAAARNDILQVVIFSILFAVALVQVEPGPRRVVLEVCDGLARVMFKLTALVMGFAPLGVGAAVAYVVGKNGFGVLAGLGKLVLTLYGALLLYVVAVFIPILWLGRIPVAAFFKTIRSPALLAFSTASSEAALPEALRLMERFGVPKRIVSFVMPAGYSFNLDGTTLYLVVAVLFVAQAAGKPLSLAQQWPILLTLMLTSKGVAGVPRAAMAILTATLISAGLPVEGVAVIMGVDAFLDMGRTAVNLTGNCLAAAVVARWEGELAKPAPDEPASTSLPEAKT